MACPFVPAACWAVEVHEDGVAVTAAGKVLISAYQPSEIGVHNLSNKVLAPHAGNISLCNAVLHHVFL